MWCKALYTFRKSTQNPLCVQKRGGDNCFLRSVEHSKIFNEFSQEQKDEFFSLTDKKVCHHIDSFYYSVSITNDDTDNECLEMQALLGQLQMLKMQKLAHPEDIVEFCGLEVSPISFSIYQYHLMLNESFDVFIAENIPNDKTPRICVQLRSRMLFLEGVAESIEKSYKYVEDLCDYFNLGIFSCSENRIDYAYHTNLLQSSAEYFSTEYLKDHLQSKLRLFHLIGNISDEVEINTFQLGNRKSNNVFLRCYNKTREVIEKNYKCFFIEAWLENKLISKYDYYCLKKAFEMRSYTTGLLVARCEWYLENGNDDILKAELKDLLVKYYDKNDNAPQIEKKIKGILPPVTVITNIEFQTKRRFYTSCDSFIEEIDKIVCLHEGKPELYRLSKILYLRRTFLDYLTSVTVNFIEDKTVSAKERKMVDWWKRIHSCKILYTDKSPRSLYRDNEKKADIAKNKRRLLSAIAKYNVLEKQSLEARTFDEDVRDVLSALNDNDIHDFNEKLKDGKLSTLRNYQYPSIFERSSRQLKGIIKEKVKEK